MKIIELTQGKKAKIDDEDYEWLNRRSWCVLKDRSGCFYALAHRKKADNPDWPALIYMHRLIISKRENRDITGDWIVDHINGDGLDNRRGNLRVCTHSQNMANHTNPPRGKIPFYGVYFDKTHDFYKAHLGRKHLGYFKTAKEAARAYNKAAKEKYGECATLNELEEE